METNHQGFRGLALATIGLSAVVLAACGATTHAEHAITNTTPRAAQGAQSRHALPSVLATGLGAFASTPVHFVISVSEHAPGVVHHPTVYGAWDPVDRDGEVAVIASTAGVESAYGASRVVGGNAWSLISGHWYTVGFGQEEIGQIVGIVDLIERTRQVSSIPSTVVDGVACQGYGGELTQGQVRGALVHGSHNLRVALTGVQHLGYQVYVSNSLVRALNIEASVAVGKTVYQTRWAVTFPGWGTQLTIRPPLPAAVLPGSAPESGLLPI